MSSHSQKPFDLQNEIPSLVELANRLCRYADPDDMVQETIVTALVQETNPRHPRQWLRKVLLNKIRMDNRSSARRRAREWSVSQVVQGPKLSQQFPDVAAANEVTQAILETLDHLDDESKNLIRMHFLEGRKAVDMAKQANCPASTMRSRIHAALEKMRRQMDKKFGGREQWLGFLLPLCELSSGSQNKAPDASLSDSTQHQTKTPGTRSGPLGIGKVAAIVALTGAILGFFGSRGEKTSLPATNSTQLDVTHQNIRRQIQRAAKKEKRFANRSHLDRSASPEGPVCEPTPVDIRRRIDRLSHLVADDVHLCTQNLGYPTKIFAEDAKFELVSDRSSLRFTMDETQIQKRSDIPILDLIDCIERSIVSVIQPTVGTCDQCGKDIDEDELLCSLLNRSSEHQQWYEQRSFELEGLASYDLLELVEKMNLPPKGNVDAPVRIFLCADLQAESNRRATKTLLKLQQRFPESVVFYSLYLQDFSVSNSQLPAKAILASQRQGKYGEMFDALLQEHTAYTKDEVRVLASTIGLDLPRFEADLKNPTLHQNLLLHQKACLDAGAAWTPAAFINDEIFSGDFSYEVYEKIIKLKLREVEERKADAKPADTMGEP